MFSRLASIATACAVTLASLIAPVQADPDRERARELYAEGRRHYDARTWRQAIAAWKEGYALAGAPMFLFNIAQAYRFAGDCAQASTYYAQYRRAAPSPPNAAELQAAEALCRDVVPPPLPEPERDPEPDGEIADAAVVRVDPSSAPRRASRARRIATLSLGTAGVAASGAGIALASRSRARWSQIESLCGSDLRCDDAATLEQARTLEVEARTAGDRATFAIGAGAVAITAALVLHLTRSDGRPTRDVAVTAWIEGEAATVLATGRF